MIDTMSLQEMESYLGRQEVPTDFDQFWQGHLSSLPDLPDFELVEKEVGLEGVACSELTFIGQGGSKIFSKVIFPKKEEKIPVLFYFHGYQGQGPDWSELAL